MQLLGIALSSFAAALAAIVASAWLDSRAKRRQAKTEILQAIHRHCDRLWRYSVEHAQAMTIGVANGATNKGQYAPRKPLMAILVTEIRGVRHLYPMQAQSAVDEIIDQVLNCDVPQSTDDQPAAWETEIVKLNVVSVKVAQWDGKLGRLPRPEDLGQAPVMS